jgi:CheY-like chemotaxis protein
MATPLSATRILPHVLLCDADADTRDLYRNSAISSRWRITEAEDGRDALAKAFADRPELVVTETRLPLLDGRTLCELLRGDPLTADIPLVIVTAEACTAELGDSAADLVIAKPCLPDDLLHEMDRVCAQSSELRKRAITARERSGGLLTPAVDVQKRPAPGGACGTRGKSRSFPRYTTNNPSLSPPALRCLWCDRPLQYTRSHVGGVSSREPEQWDYYTCPVGCGEFQYRQRTRKIRQVE